MSGSLLLLPLALPLLLTARVDAGLVARTSFAEVSSDPEVVRRLASVYAGVEELDLWTGGLCEDHVPDALVGELLLTIRKPVRKPVPGNLQMVRETCPRELANGSRAGVYRAGLDDGVSG